MVSGWGGPFSRDRGRGAKVIFSPQFFATPPFSFPAAARVPGFNASVAIREGEQQ
jgi:hypothetical protein